MQKGIIVLKINLVEISAAEGHLLALKSPVARSKKATFRGVGSPPSAAYKGQ